MHNELSIQIYFPYVLQDLSKNIPLTEADEHDLIEIIKRVMPHAPKFKILLESQLRNATSKDPRHRRWHPNMISLCLNLWAK